jgi:hypothetical protein
MIAKMEAEKQREDAQQVDDRTQLTEAKKVGKEAHTALKAWLVQEHAAVSEAKKMEKSRLATKQKVY